MTDQEAPAAAPEITYKDEDLVYVDPDTRSVVGFVEWSNAGKPKPLAIKQEPKVKEGDEEEEEKGGRKRPQRVRYYPWGTYRSMKRVYKIEGKPAKIESQKTLDEVIEKALTEPFWD